MKCKEKRNLFDLLKVFTCEKCKYFFTDESYLIGGDNINIYYLDHNCLDEKLDDYYIANNMKLKIFIKDIIHNKNDIIIWLTREENYLLKDMKIIYNLLSFENNIHILVF